MPEPPIMPRIAFVMNFLRLVRIAAQHAGEARQRHYASILVGECGSNKNTSVVPATAVSSLPLVGEGWGEGFRSLDRAQPLTRIASVDAIRPLPQGERRHVRAGAEAIFKQPGGHCEPTGRRKAPPDDMLREAIHCHRGKKV